LSSIALCKDKHANEYFKHNGKMIPLRHLAPEVLKTNIFSTASDVFACGVTIWEVFNFGALPFASIANEEFLQMLQNNSVDYGKLFETGGMPSELQKTLVRETNEIR
jgi:serine/threonine protein kinase